MCFISCVEVVGDWLYYFWYWLEFLKKILCGEFGNGFEFGDWWKMLWDFVVMEMKFIRRVFVLMLVYDNFRRGCDFV